MQTRQPTWRLWKGSEETETASPVSHGESYDDSDLEITKIHLPPRPIYILSDEKNNPVSQEHTGTVLAVHMFPYHVNVFLTTGETLEFKTKNFPRGQVVNGACISFVGSPIYVEGNPKSFLFVHCKLA
jgi:hypothetical protein